MAYEVRISDGSSDVCASDLKALDNFLVQDPFGRPFDHPDQLARLETSIEDAFANRTRLADRLKAQPLPRARAEAVEIAPNAIIDNGASNRFTVSEVNARDGPALLNRLAPALFPPQVRPESRRRGTGAVGTWSTRVS